VVFSQEVRASPIRPGKSQDVARLKSCLARTGLAKVLVACFVVEGLFETNINERFLRFGLFVESNERFGV
jgi:hypothetical protein